MTRTEILDCLTDRPCEVCKFHESGRCERWECVFEEKPEDCEDCISRQAVMDALCNDCKLYKNGEHKCFSRCEEYHFLVTLPSVTPKQTVGKWIYTKAVSTGEIIWSECSVCGEGAHGCAKRMKFCPMCGARMGERSEKE